MPLPVSRQPAKRGRRCPWRAGLVTHRWPCSHTTAGRVRPLRHAKAYTPEPTWAQRMPPAMGGIWGEGVERERRRGGEGTRIQCHTFRIPQEAVTTYGGSGCGGTQLCHTTLTPQEAVATCGGGGVRKNKQNSMKGPTLPSFSDRQRPREHGKWSPPRFLF